MHMPKFHDHTILIVGVAFWKFDTFWPLTPLDGVVDKVTIDFFGTSTIVYKMT